MNATEQERKPGSRRTALLVAVVTTIAAIVTVFVVLQIEWALSQASPPSETRSGTTRQPVRPQPDAPGSGAHPAPASSANGQSPSAGKR